MGGHSFPRQASDLRAASPQATTHPRLGIVSKLTVLSMALWHGPEVHATSLGTWTFLWMPFILPLLSHSRCKQLPPWDLQAGWVRLHDCPMVGNTLGSRSGCSRRYLGNGTPSSHPRPGRVPSLNLKPRFLLRDPQAGYLRGCALAAGRTARHTADALHLLIRIAFAHFAAFLRPTIAKTLFPHGSLTLEFDI